MKSNRSGGEITPDELSEEQNPEVLTKGQHGVQWCGVEVGQSEKKSEWFVEDPRNIVDEFKYFPVEVIRARLAERRRPFGTLALNIEKDLNVATLVRNHNAFCGLEFFYLGRRKYNRQGTVGTYLYEQITHLASLESALEGISKDYTWIGVDNREGSVPITEFIWPEKPLLVFGHEKEGLDYLPELIPHCESIVKIPQVGSVRSLNVGCASAIALYDLCAKKGWI